MVEGSWASSLQGLRSRFEGSEFHLRVFDLGSTGWDNVDRFGVKTTGLGHGSKIHGANEKRRKERVQCFGFTVLVRMRRFKAIRVRIWF